MPYIKANNRYLKSGSNYIKNFGVLNYGPVLWTDASDETTIHLSDATHVEQWDDKSGNDNHLTQTILSEQPTKEINQIYFEGIKSELKIGGIKPFKTLFIVYDGWNLDGLFHRLFSLSYNIDIGVLWFNSDDLRYYGFSGNIVYPTTNETRLFWHRFSTDVDGNNKLVYADYNLGYGGDISSFISTGLNYINGTFIAGGHISSNYSLNDRIKEIIGFDRIITVAELNKVKAYLETKWNII